jgi:nucleotide-binding universal stress UspA family protein
MVMDASSEHDGNVKDRTVICAIDDDKRAGDVVVAARRLAAVADLRPLFVHVREAGAQTGGDRARATERAFMGLGVAREELRCEAGNARSAVVRVAREERAALALAGAGRRGMIARALLGGVCGALSDDPSCPVAVVPDGADVGFAGGPIVCAVDGGDDEPVIRWAAAFAAAADCWLVLVHIVTLAPLAAMAAVHGGAGPAAPMLLETEEETALARLQAIRRRLPRAVRSDATVRCGDVPAELVELAQDLRADALVVGTRGRRPVHDIVFGSVVERLFDLAVCPVVVVRLP